MAVNKVILGTETLIDLSNDTVTADSLTSGATAHDNQGEIITGTLIVKPEQEKTFSTTENGNFEVIADEGKTLSKVNVDVDVKGTIYEGQFTGHVDREGLASIGWTEEDIDYYEANGVVWYEEQDQYHLVNDYDKQMWQDYQNGEYTSIRSFVTSHKDVQYLPKIDTSNIALYSFFSGCKSLITFPLIDTSIVTNLTRFCEGCTSLTTIPPIDTSNVTNMSDAFRECTSLLKIPFLNTAKVEDFNSMFKECCALQTIPSIDTSASQDISYIFSNCTSLKEIPSINLSNITVLSSIFYCCEALTTIPIIDISKVSNTINAFNNANVLRDLYLKGLKTSLMCLAPTLTKESMVYIINNAQTVTNQTMKFGTTNLAKLTDEEKAVATGKGWTLA